MSKFVQKTLHSINAVLNNSGIFYTERERFLSSKCLSLAVFQEKMKSVEAKHEEEKFVIELLQKIEKRLSEPDVSCAEVEELVKICIVCHALDYRCQFIYVHALKLAQKGNFQQKHTGYLATEFFLHPQHELVILLINTIQKDLNSSNHLEVILALTVVCHLINNETVHNVLHLVESKLFHQMPSVRKCAVLTLSHCLYLMGSESAYQMSLPKLEKCLSDSELDVVSAVIPTLHKVIKKVKGDFSYLLDSLLQLLEQVLMRRIPHCMNYSDIPAPWLQVEILKLLRHVCTSEEHSKKVIPLLKKTLAQSGLYHAVAQAIVCQVLETIGCIDADPELIEMAMSSITLLLKSRDVNMKFMGLEALILIVKKAESNITILHQDMIIDCLKLPDESLQLKTLELMHHLANPANVEAISKKMVEFLDHVKGSKKRELADKILTLAEKYKNRHKWYISVMLAVIEKVSPLLTSTDVCKIIGALKQDEELKLLAKQDVGKCLCQQDSVPAPLIKIYVCLVSEPSDFQVVLPLLDTVDEDSVSWIFLSLMDSILKHRLATKECVEAVQKLNQKYKNSYSLDLLIKQVLLLISNVDNVTKKEISSKVDPSLSFLDNYVVESLHDSTCLYEPASLRLSSDSSPLDMSGHNFSVVSTEASGSPNCGTSFVLKSPSYSTFSSPSASFQSLSNETEGTPPAAFRKQAIWTKEGRSKKGEERTTEGEKEEQLLKLFAGVI